MKRMARYAVGLAAVVALAAVSAVPGWAQNAPKTAVAKTAPTVAKVVAPVAQKPAAKQAPKGMHTGITVHGWWKIDVRNPDGKLVEHREFENSLTTGGIAPTDITGDMFLTGLLDRTITPGQWVVTLTAVNGTNFALQLGEPGPACANVGGCVQSLSIAPTGSDSGSLALVGAVSVPLGTPSGASIGLVSTQNSAQNAGAFTTAFPSPAIQVSAGQLVNVSVTFSFQ